MSTADQHRRWLARQKRAAERRQEEFDFNGPAAAPAAPTPSPPGSPGKLKALAARAERCEALFHPDDAQEGLRDGHLGRKVGDAALVRLAQVMLGLNGEVEVVEEHEPATPRPRRRSERNRSDADRVRDAARKRLARRKKKAADRGWILEPTGQLVAWEGAVVRRGPYRPAFWRAPRAPRARVGGRLGELFPEWALAA